MPQPEVNIIEISAGDLLGVIERAGQERLRSLTLVSSNSNWIIGTLAPKHQEAVHILDRLPHNALEALATLDGLESLAVINFDIGAEGARKLAGLSKLSSLDVGYNSIGAEGARELAGLSKLTSLDVRYNSIGAEGARELAGLSKLTSLDVRYNSIGAEGARELAGLSNLTALNVHNNSIGDQGARELAGLSHLTSLDVRANSIGAAGARELAGLSNLTSLNVRNNRIGDAGARAILEAWSTGPAVARRAVLDLRYNGDLSSVLPAEPLNTRDAQAILAAYRRFRQGDKEETLQALNEAKLLLVGNEGAGKTSLVRYLVDGLPRHDSEDPARGTAIRENVDTKTWPADQAGGITLNVWDFGGQVIMRGTHQYFLTRRSLYLLVLDARFEDDLSIYDWLRIIRNRADDSPVIVVINKCDGDRRGPRLPEERIKKEYGVVDFIRTSCDKGDEAAATIQDLRELIAQTLATHPRLEHIHAPFPRPYLRVKETVAALAKDQNLLDRARFEQICERGDKNEAVSDPAEQRLLLGTLHDLGVVVAHGFDRDDPAVRREVTLLDPNWLTGAVYKIITSARLVQQHGELPRTQLSELLEDPNKYPEDRHEFILDMMQDPDIGLSFQLPGTNPPRYLIPEALHNRGPFYGNFWDDSLRFRYTYKLLPRGLMPRFIVESHREAVQQTTRWLTGVVLKASDCEILVEADLDQKQIDIRVKGPPKLRRAALHVALTHLEHVHALNRDLGQEARLPLPDDPDVSVAYDYLLELENDPEAGPNPRFRPEGAKRFYTVAELLEGVREDRPGNVPKETSNVTKIIVNIGNGVQFHGDFAVGKKIQDSFNKSQASSSSDEIKALLGKLAGEVAKVAEQLSDDDAGDLADDLESFTKEAVKPQPKPGRWESVAERIGEAAEAVGQIGGTAVTLLENLRPLLLG